MHVQYALLKRCDEFFGEYLAVGDADAVVAFVRSNCSHCIGIKFFGSEYRNMVSESENFCRRWCKNETAPFGRVQRGHDERRRKATFEQCRERLARDERRTEEYKIMHDRE